ncbi:hypothetical protein DFH08DRAFT_656096, partial [Mycena albidolilacea]
ERHHVMHSEISAISTTYTTEGSPTIRSLHSNYTAPLVHRFSLFKPGAKPQKTGSNRTVSPMGSSGNGKTTTGWNPLDLFFSSSLLIAECDTCVKRRGWKPVLECDDCGL